MARQFGWCRYVPVDGCSTRWKRALSAQWTWQIYRNHHQARGIDHHQYSRRYRWLWSLIGQKPEDYVSPGAHALFWSLRGAVGYCQLTQHWVQVFVVALQRHSQKSQRQHLRTFNIVLNRMQHDPAALFFQNMTCGRELRVDVGAAFKQEETIGFSLRGGVHLRLGTSQGEPKCHLLFTECKSTKLVIRNVFPSKSPKQSV